MAMDEVNRNLAQSLIDQSSEINSQAMQQIEDQQQRMVEGIERKKELTKDAEPDPDSKPKPSDPWWVDPMDDL